MVRVSTAELIRRFGHYSELARREPVLVTHHGREALVLLSADAYRRLRALDDREVYLRVSFPMTWLQPFRRACPWLRRATSTTW